MSKMRKRLSILTLVLFVSIAAWTQTKISGTVKDQNGDPVPFATINVKGSNVTLAADVNGSFTLPAKSGDVLVVTAVGIDKIETTVGNDPVVAIVANRSSGTINDVVVTTALGIKRSKNELPYAAQKVNGRCSGLMDKACLCSYRWSSSFVLGQLVARDWPAPDSCC